MTDEFDDQDFDFDDLDEGVEEQPAEESSNRSFWIAVSVLGIVILFTLICLVAFFFISRNNAGGGRAEQQTQAAIAYAQATEQALAVAQTAEAAAWTSTPTVTPTSTHTPTPTEVIAQATNTQVSTPDPRTATVEALLTLAAQSSPVATVLPTQLPNTGIFDDMAGVGFAGLVGLALLAVALIVLARRLRTSSS